MKRFRLTRSLPALAVIFAFGCGSDDDPVDPQPMGPPDISGTYSLQSLTGAITGGITIGPPIAQGTLMLTQTSVDGDTAMGTSALSIMVPDQEGGVTTIEDAGTYTMEVDGAWEQTGNIWVGLGTATLVGNVFTITVIEPATAASTSVWQKQ